MNVSQCISCVIFPCRDVRQESHIMPNVELEAERISVVMISESAPEDPRDYYYAGGESLFEQTTVLAFQDAGADVQSIWDILDRGVYLTSAVKCGKTGYEIKAKSIESCSCILEKELELFPNIKVYLLMGDVAIKAINSIARRAGQKLVIPAGSTYKIRGGDFYFRGARAFPSYLQAGPSFFIEKSKRKMIAEDIRQALSMI